jgi:excisionase family DNA binding protein
MSTNFINDVSPEVLEIARAIQSAVDRAVKRAEAERQTTPKPPEKVGVREAAEILSVKPRTVYAYVEQGKLSPQRTGPQGGKLVFLRADVERVRDSA